MGSGNYWDELKRDAVQQIFIRGYPVREIARRFGVLALALQVHEVSLTSAEGAQRGPRGREPTAKA